MSFSPQLSWFVIVFLALSVTWKVSARLSDSFQVEAAVVDFLNRHQFDAAVSHANTSGRPVISATSGSCRMSVIADTQWKPDTFEDAAVPIDHLYLVFQGRVYDARSSLAPVMGHKLLRMLRRLGFIQREAPLISVATSGSCAIKEIRWEELKAL
jgi:hypothetical protein